MAALVIIAIAVLFFYWVLKIGGMLDSKSNQSNQPSRPTPTYSPHTVRDIPKPQQPSYTNTSNAKGCDEWLQEPCGDYKEFDLVGMQYLHLEDSDFGVNYGIALAETDNPYDKDAVSIRRSTYGKQLAFIPKNRNSELHKYLMSTSEKQSPAHFKIWTRDGVKIYGKAYIEVLPYTTEEELKGYEIIRDICSEIVERHEIGYKDTHSYLNITLGASTRNTICRLYLNTANKYLEYASFSSGTRKYIKVRINKLNDIWTYKSDILDALTYVKDNKK